MQSKKQQDEHHKLQTIIELITMDTHTSIQTFSDRINMLCAEPIGSSLAHLETSIVLQCVQQPTAAPRKGKSHQRLEAS